MSIVNEKDKHPYIDLGQDYKISLNYADILDEKHLAMAKEDLRETPEIREQALKELRELIEGEKNFVHATDDFFLLSYLRPCKFYAKSALERMQTYYSFKLKYKKYIDNITVESVRNIIEDGIFKYSPLCDKNGRRIVFIQCGKSWKLDRGNKYELFRCIQIIFQAVALEPLTQIYGVSMVLDMGGLSMDQVLTFTPSFASMCLKWAHDCLPLRLKKIYIVNNSKIFNIFWALFGPFMSAKLKERVHFINQNYDVLAEYMGKECLGKEYDGSLPVEHADGKVFVEFLKLYEKQFELLNASGFVEENDDIGDRRNKVNTLAKEILRTIKVK
ncbi:retinaldehyde-binding protein 1-like [Chironomus tepperi]|uniref:retinaldehyde-binding protein 1-like n=1 Tax=Chironomus tepperi TaxID=113505 RepID=UPI00391FC62E